MGLAPAERFPEFRLKNERTGELLRLVHRQFPIDDQTKEEELAILVDLRRCLLADANDEQTFHEWDDFLRYFELPSTDETELKVNC